MQRTFTPHDQQQFAQLSGDFNPMHLDPEIGARLLFGSTVVHGVHGLLWALERGVACGLVSGRLKWLKTAFKHPIRVGETVRLLPDAHRPDSTRLRLLLGERVATTLHASRETVVDPEHPL
ncbi:MAG: MaoC family dehydratase, partial [Magnetococcales bacterium]|nr:MaoC family dehydratase [Magnetococcales bacterium]